jgi:DNA-binding Lrp family transcriptional regulator
MIVPTAKPAPPVQAPRGRPSPALGDVLDRALLAHLQTNARASVTELAALLGVARSTVMARMQRLESEGVILGYSVRLAQSSPDSGVQAQVCMTVEPRAGREVERQVRRLPNVQQLLAVSGPYDYLAVVQARTPAELNTVLDELGQISGVTKTMSLIVLANKLDRRA